MVFWAVDLPSRGPSRFFVILLASEDEGIGQLFLFCNEDFLWHSSFAQTAVA